MSSAAVAARLPQRKQRPHIDAKPEANGLFSFFALALCDVLVIIVIAILVLLTRQLLNGRIELRDYGRLWPVISVFLAAYAGFGLYPGVTIGPVAEIRRATEATTLVFLLLASMTFLMRDALNYSRLSFFAAWIGVLLALPLARSTLRRTVCLKKWWGYPVVVFGNGRSTERVVRTLLAHPERGLKPFVILDDTISADDIAGVPLASRSEPAWKFAHLGINHAVIAMSGFSNESLTRTIEAEASPFPHLTIVPDMPGLSSLFVESREYGQMLALHIRKNLLLPGPKVVKRVMDLFFGILFGIGFLPFATLIALAIKLDSRGPITYSHWRLGHSGKKFRLVKFRTMFQNSDAILARHLETDAREALEWKLTQKLKRDPRTTRVGRFLRRTSMDELPQLWNVARGEMSLVGPRPIVDAEVQRYGDYYSLYSQVLPGLTGMWQVSGRSDTDYNRRVELDSYYVRNWSPWLDVYLVARTFKVVVRGEGAY
jgi:Undecaprenyl-phosphate galactose phosphotransferase WbaP